MVEGLVQRGTRVHYLLREDRYWRNVLDEEESKLVEERLKRHGVKIHYHSELGKIIGKRGRLVAIQTKAGKTLKCQILAVAIGVRPRLELARTAGLKIDRGVLVDQYMHTSREDIFAAGDVAQVYDPYSGKYVLDSLWRPALEQGQAAGANMAGASQAYIKTIAFNVTRLAGLTTTIIGMVGRGDDPDLFGIARGDSEVYRLLPGCLAVQDSFDANHLRLVIGKDRLLGAIIMGDQTLTRPLRELVSEKVDISPVREQLLAPGRHAAQTILDFWVKWKGGSRAYAK
jgi:NAD(P)H-nitrite reductase large subunit